MISSLQVVTASHFVLSKDMCSVLLLVEITFKADMKTLETYNTILHNVLVPVTAGVL